MDQQEQHEMVLATTHSSGAEEWFCPTCGRRFLLRWPPTYEKVIIEPGDELAAHSGSKGDMLSMGAARIDSQAELPAEDELLTRHRARSVADAPAFPPVIRSAADEELGDVPITDELRPWLRWLGGDDTAEPTKQPDQ